MLSLNVPRLELPGRQLAFRKRGEGWECCAHRVPGSCVSAVGILSTEMAHRAQPRALRSCEAVGLASATAIKPRCPPMLCFSQKKALAGQYKENS